MRSIRRPVLLALAALLHAAVLGAVALRAQDAVTAPTSLSKALPVQATGEQILPGRVLDLPWRRRQGRAAAGGGVRPADAQRSRLPRLHRLRHQHGGAAGRLGGGGPARRTHPRARSPHAGLRRCPLGRAAPAGREVPVELLPEPGVAARRLEPAPGLLHREGVPRERGRVDDRRHHLGRPRPSRTSSSTNIASGPAASTK